MHDPHEELLADWEASPKHAGRFFIRDGIIDRELWERTSPKLLFILREAYDDSQESTPWDLRVVIREYWQGPKYKIWRTVADWAHGICGWHRGGMPRRPVDAAVATEALLSCAAINIKKSNGRSSSSTEDLRGYVEADGERLQRQVELIDPDIIVCGSTWDLIRHLWPDRREVFDSVWEVKNRLIVDYGHPANRYSHRLNYYTLLALLEGAWKNGARVRGKLPHP